MNLIFVSEESVENLEYLAFTYIHRLTLLNDQLWPLILVLFKRHFTLTTVGLRGIRIRIVKPPPPP